MVTIDKEKIIEWLTKRQVATIESEIGLHVNYDVSDEQGYILDAIKSGHFDMSKKR